MGARRQPTPPPTDAIKPEPPPPPPLPRSGAIPIEIDNHHNALACPYCNPNGDLVRTGASGRGLGYLVARKRDTEPFEVVWFDRYDEAALHFADVATQWSTVYFCRVAHCEGEPLDIQPVFNHLKALKDQAEAKAAKLRLEVGLVSAALDVSSAVTKRLQAVIEATWTALYRCFELEPRETFETESKTNGFEHGLVQAVHAIWKRDPNVAELLATIETMKRKIADLEGGRE